MINPSSTHLYFFLTKGNHDSDLLPIFGVAINKCIKKILPKGNNKSYAES